MSSSKAVISLIFTLNIITTCTYRILGKNQYTHKSKKQTKTKYFHFNPPLTLENKINRITYHGILNYVSFCLTKHTASLEKQTSFINTDEMNSD